MSDNEQNVTDGDFPVFKTRRKKASKKIVEDILPAEIYNQPAEIIPIPASTYEYDTTVSSLPLSSSSPNGESTHGPAASSNSTFAPMTSDPSKIGNFSTSSRHTIHSHQEIETAQLKQIQVKAILQQIEANGIEITDSITQEVYNEVGFDPTILERAHDAFISSLSSSSTTTSKKQEQEKLETRILARSANAKDLLHIIGSELAQQRQVTAENHASQVQAQRNQTQGNSSSSSIAAKQHHAGVKTLAAGLEEVQVDISERNAMLKRDELFKQQIIDNIINQAKKTPSKTNLTSSSTSRYTDVDETTTNRQRNRKYNHNEQSHIPSTAQLKYVASNRTRNDQQQARDFVQRQKR